MLGFAILMTGMQTMSGAVAPLRESPVFIDMLTMFSNPIAGILVGICFTAVLQSASATVGVLQALIRNRNPDICKCIPDRSWYRCRSSLSGSDLSDRS